MVEALETLRALSPIGAGGLIVLVVWMILTDKLFTRPRLDEAKQMLQDRIAAVDKEAQWLRQANELRAEQAARQADQIDSLVDTVEKVLHIVEKFQAAVKR